MARMSPTTRASTASQSSAASWAQAMLVTRTSRSLGRPSTRPRMRTGKSWPPFSAATRRRASAEPVVWTAAIVPIASPRARASLTIRSTWACSSRPVPNWRMAGCTTSELDHGLDHAGLGPDPLGEPRRRVLKPAPVRNQFLDLDRTVADRRQDLAEILDGGVAAALERDLALVEVGIGEADIGADYAHQDQRAAMRHPAEALLHGRRVAGGVEDEIEEVVAGKGRQAIARGLVGGDAVAQAEHVAAEGEPVGARVEEGHLRSPRAGEKRRGDADRPGTHDQGAL